MIYTNVYQRGNYLYVRGVEDGRRFNEKVDFRPTLWITGKQKGSPDWTTLEGKPVQPIQPGSMYDCKQFVEQYKDVNGFTVYESPGHVYQYIAENYPGELRFDPADISVFTYDIETSVDRGFPDPAIAAERIVLLTIKDTRHNQIITWGLGPYDNDRPDVEYREFGTEQGLLKDFIVWWQQNCPDVITGWNISLFDNTYLYNRMCNVLGDALANKLSPHGQVIQREIDLGGRTAIKTTFAGVSCLDYLDLYKKFGTYSAKESYKLDFIANEELGIAKIENPGTSFRDFQENYWQTFVAYNIRDTELVDKLDAKMKLMDLALTMAYGAKVNYEDVFSPVRVWDVIIYNCLNDRNVVIPRRPQGKKEGQIEGAFVKDPLKGKHRWLVSFDYDSMYPHLTMMYNISPETIGDVHVPVTVDKMLAQEYDFSELKEANLAIAANGWTFRRDKKGILPTLMQLYYDKRVVAKNQMLDAKQQYETTKDDKWKAEISRLNNLQLSTKILINAAYGAQANAGFRYFDTRTASAITISGQLGIRWLANDLNEYLNKVCGTQNVDRVVLIDTDSCVLCLDDLVEAVFQNKNPSTEKVIQFLDKVASEKLQPVVQKSCERLADYTNAYEQKLRAKRENLVDTMISVSKKRYVMSVHNSEGVQYKEPQLKIMGLQMVKSSTPAVIRDKLKDSLHTILYGTEADVQKYVKDFRDAFNNFAPEEIAFPRSISDVGKYQNAATIYSKGTPIHVRGALLYNHLLKKMELDKKYPLIREGDKIKFMYLRTPNPIREDCISFVDKLPVEFELTQYVDYGKMFEKTFQDAVQNILDSLGWSAEQRATLEDWFS